MDREKNLKRIKLEERNTGCSVDSLTTIHAGSTGVSAEERVFANHFLLFRIIGYLHLKNMKIVRFVCSSLNTAVLSILEKSGRLSLEGNFYKDGPSKPKVCYFNLEQELTTVERQLPDLLAVIRSSPRFPCQDFRFRRGSIRNPCLREFFSLYGSRIRRLYLDVHFTRTGWHDDPNTYATPEELFTILRVIPNVEHLELNYIPQTEKWKQGNVSENVQNKNKDLNETNKTKDCSIFSRLLPNLKILKLDYNLPDWFFLTLVETSRNLKQVRIKWGGRDNYFTRTNKLYLIKKMHFEHMRQLGNDYKIISTHLDVSLLKLQVYAQGIPSSDPSGGQILSDIFKYNQNTLKSVYFDTIGHVPQLQLPQLPKVLKLEIEKQFEPNNGKLFPPVDMSKIFPNLKHLMINMGPGLLAGLLSLPSFAPIHEYFDICPSPMPTVESLCFVCNRSLFCRGEMYPSDFMEFFAKLCPRVNYAEFRGIKAFTQESGDIWKFFGKLTRLKLSFDVTKNPPILEEGHHLDRYPEHTLHSIDSFFTGISAENLKGLATWKLDGNGYGNAKHIEEMRTHPSILLLKDLRQLEIVVCNVEELDAERPFVPILTDASRYFAFDLCHKLQLSVSFQLQNRKQLPDILLACELQEWMEVTKYLRVKSCPGFACRANPSS